VWQFSTYQLRHVVAWDGQFCRADHCGGGGRIGRPSHQHSDPNEGRHAGREDGQNAINSYNFFLHTDGTV